MHSIYPPGEFYTSDLIDISKFLADNQVSKLLPSSPFEDDSHEKSRVKDIMKLMETELDDDYKDILESYCRPSELINSKSSDSLKNCYGNPLLRKARVWFEPIKICDDARRFQTITRLEQRIKNDVKYTYKSLLKYQNGINIPKQEGRPSIGYQDLIPGQEVLIKIQIYRPITPTGSQKLHLSHDLVVLGSHTLDVLRDNVNCPNDLRVLNDMSANPDSTPEMLSKDVFKSAFLFIEDTFYDDHRCADNIEYSKCIIDWAKHKKDIGPLKCQVMEATTFRELKVRLGYPQVFQHQGNCEHIFIFSDIEILQPSDSCYSSSYPYYKTITPVKAIYCNMCGRFVAKWVVQGNKRIPFDPSYFCDDCFQSYNYVDGKKIGDFKAYPYFDKRSSY